MRRGLLAVLVGGLVLAGVVLALQRMREGVADRAAFPQLAGRLSVDGLRAAVTVHRDDHGVPHVGAQNELDAFFGLGFVHAQDRLGQMLWLARQARGRTAEVLGEAGLPADRLARTLDLAGLAEEELARLDAATRRSLAAYSAGVNARIQLVTQGRVAPPRVLRERGIAPDLWGPADSLAVFKLYSWELAGTLDVSLVLSELIDHLGGFAARRFFPGRPDGDGLPPLRPPTTAGRDVPAPSARDLSALVPDPLRRATGLAGRTVGSSAWLIAGAHTASGLPMLIADAHLPPTVPAFFHLAHFRGGNLDVAGATLPGVPVVWTGHNASVAWASTNARAVTCDLFQELLHRSDGGRYHDGRGWRELEVREETIDVRGAAPEVLVVRSSHHGPLVTELAGGGPPVALTWSGAREGRRSGVVSLLALARARSGEELLAALALHEEPTLVFAWISAAGGGGVHTAGWIPERTLSTGLVPVPGRARWYDWHQRIPFQDLPGAALAEPPGFLVAADGEPADAAGIEWLWRTGVRARRIETLLRDAVASGSVGLRDQSRLQADQRSAPAPELVGLALELAEIGPSAGPEVTEVVRLLEGWDGAMTAGSSGAAAYHVFLRHLVLALLAPRLGDGLLEAYLRLPQADPQDIVLGILREALAGAADAGGFSDRESVRAAVRESLRDASLELAFQLGSNRAKWGWGRLHRLAFRPFGSDALGAAAPTALGPFAYGGDASTIQAAEFGPGDGYDVRLASTFRFAVDARALDQSLVALAPGQSEHAGHPHYADGLAPWLDGGAHLLATSQLLVEESSAAELVLEPTP